MKEKKEKQSHLKGIRETLEDIVNVKDLKRIIKKFREEKAQEEEESYKNKLYPSITDSLISMVMANKNREKKEDDANPILNMLLFNCFMNQPKETETNKDFQSIMEKVEEFNTLSEAEEWDGISIEPSSYLDGWGDPAPAEPIIDDKSKKIKWVPSMNSELPSPFTDLELKQRAMKLVEENDIPKSEPLISWASWAYNWADNLSQEQKLAYKEWLRKNKDKLSMKKDKPKAKTRTDIIDIKDDSEEE